MKIVTIVGARPQFIKCAAVSRELRKVASEVLVHTGQHYDANMSDVFFAELGIPPPDYGLGIGSGTHGQQTGNMLVGIEKVLLTERPDWVLVYGDTNSTLAGALAAVKLQIPVAHVEAGLRSFNKRMPEEINRIMTDHASTLLLAPSLNAVENLRRESFSEAHIRHVGDVMYDAILFYRDSALTTSRVLRTLGLRPRQYVLATIHRAENTADPVRMNVIWNAITRLSEEMPLVIPMHPRTKLVLERYGAHVHSTSSLLVIDPVGYLDMVMLQANSRLVITDSGGIQKESFFCRTPCVTLRDETEWPELLQLGWNKLAPPTELSTVLDVIRDALQQTQLPDDQTFPYGTGDAVPQIVKALSEATTLKVAA